MKKNGVKLKKKVLIWETGWFCKKRDSLKSDTARYCVPFQGNCFRVRKALQNSSFFSREQFSWTGKHYGAVLFRGNGIILRKTVFVWKKTVLILKNGINLKKTVLIWKKKVLIWKKTILILKNGINLKKTVLIWKKTVLIWKKRY